MVKNLIFISSGDAPLVFKNDGIFETKGLDVVISFYGRSEEGYQSIKSKVKYATQIKGTKFNNFIHLVRSGAVNLKEYDYVGLFDDDLMIVSGCIGNIFDQAIKCSSDVCTPSHHPLGKVSFSAMATKIHRGNYRLVNFIEMTCPVFRSELLSDFVDWYSGSLDGWGVDWFYMNFAIRSGYKKFHVFDNLVVYNPHDSQKNGIRELSRYISVDKEIRQYREFKDIVRIDEWAVTTVARLRSADDCKYLFRIFIVGSIFIKRGKNYFCRKLLERFDS